MKLVDRMKEKVTPRLAMLKEKAAGPRQRALEVVERAERRLRIAAALHPKRLALAGGDLERAKDMLMRAVKPITRSRPAAAAKHKVKRGQKHRHSH